MRPSPAVLLLSAAVVVLVFGLVGVRERARTDRGARAHRTDFTVYTAAAKALGEGADPYDARSPRGWRYVYPPLLAIALRPLTALSTPDAAFVWYLVGVLALAYALVATARAIGGRTGRASVALALLVCLLFVGQTFQRGQVTTLLLALQVGALALLARRREALAGVVLALGVALRLTPLLPAGVVGVACLRRLVRGDGLAALRFPIGFAAGLVLWFAAVPAALLGPSRALDVTKRWLEVGGEVYASAPGKLADLSGAYGIEEHIYKNQGVRRVAATWSGWTSGAPFEGERAELGDGWASVDRFAFAVAVVVGALALLVGWRAFGDPASRSTRLAYAAACLAPVLVTRYAWPVHYAVAIPFLAECLASPRRSAARLGFFVLLAGTVLFALGYLGSAAALRLPARAGVLAIATIAAIVLAIDRRRHAPSSRPRRAPHAPADAA